MSKLYSPQIKNPRLLKPNSAVIVKPTNLFNPKQ